MSESRRTLVVAAVLIATATALGAFGTHALKPMLTAARFASFETGVSYQFFHALGMLAIGVLQRDARYDTPMLRAAVRILLAGIVLFAGSLYALTFGAPRWFGMVAPFGGVSLMLGWLVFAAGVSRGATAASVTAASVDALTPDGDVGAAGLAAPLGRTR